MNDFLSNDQLKRLDAYWRASNYLAVGQIYLKDNPLLRKPLQPNHIKPRLLGHWGTTPGLNLIYVHLNLLITAHDLDMILITGPGHGGPAIVAQSYLEGSFTQCYPSVEQNENGILRLFRQFSWPYGLSSHVSAQIPGSIHEGGELGYSLAHAYGAAFDNPDLIVACVIGDGEAETGTLAASWHSNKFLNPRRDGAVLPILHLNGFKIANPTLLSRISEDELSALMYGYGYEPYFVEGDDASTVHQQLARTLEELLLKIREIQRRARTGSHEDAQERALWPMLVLRTPKGWTGPKLVDGQPVEGTWRAHQVPLCHFEQPLHLLQLEQWLGSYRPDELFDDDGTLMPDIAAMAPTGHRRLGANPHANGGLLLEALDLPRFTDYALPVPTPGGVQAEATRLLGGYLRDVMKRNLKAANFRLFGPDETASNRLDAVYEASAKTWMASLEAGDTNLDCDGRVMEILSEQVCEGWLEGYLDRKSVV